MTSEQPDELELLQGDCGNQHILGSLLEKYRSRLRRMVRLRLDSRLRRRIDASDVVQEAYLEVARRLPEYLSNPSMPFGLWLRLITGQKILTIHRRHLGARARDARREIALVGGQMPQASSEGLAAKLIGQFTTPSHRAIKAELRLRLQETLNKMEPLDREILALRHFEQLKMSEAAQVLGIKHTAACNRYVRALERLREMMGSWGESGEVPA